MSFLQKITHLNSARRADYLPLFIDDAQIGMLSQENLAHLQAAGLDLQVNHAVRNVIWHAPKAIAARNDLLAHAAEKLAKIGYVTGWRDELLPIRHHYHAPTLAVIERAAAPVIGLHGFGVHLNGLTRKNKQIFMWLARRSASKPLEPNKMDQIVAGGMPEGISIFANLCKEGQEEANIPLKIMQQARSVGTFRYYQQVENGIRCDTIFNYDLWLPEDFIPQNQDDEVSEFLCLPIEEVQCWLEESNDFKSNSAVTIIDFLIRHGYLTPEHPEFADICANLQPQF